MKFVLALALCIAFAAVLEAKIPISHTMRHDDFEPIKEGWHIPSYEYKYGVFDPKSGDHKEQWEHRHHDIVKGHYWLHEPDGTKRIVEYTSDPKTGFHAIVKTEGLAEHPY
ncbi:cuticle protein 19-like [Phlebotomus papatasi]|uniref:cuticle protein 19-like n=1 Tax=Phlebotomus papatasi TaxID=29031 RepID=UPI002483F86C|nr:cuticle protein 19-like [Phlebotomus papatasi]